MQVRFRPLRRAARSLWLLVLALIPCLTLMPPARAQSGLTVADAGFETVTVGPAGTFSSYQYDPAGSPWAFSGSAGIAASGSGFTYANPAAPDGAQVAFLQGAGTITQAIGGFQAGTGYQVAFSAAQRGSGNTAVQNFQVYLDTTLLGTFTPGSASYAPLTTTPIVPGAGTHTLRFVGLCSAGGDNTALLDNIQLQTVAFGPPATVSATAGTDPSGDSQVTLTWTASPGAAHYNLYRGTSSGGETLLKAGLTGTSYTDPATNNTAVYYYQASAVGADGTESARSGEAIPPVTTGHWLHCDASGKLIGDEGWPTYFSTFSLTGPLTGSASSTGIDITSALQPGPPGNDWISDYISPSPLDPLTCWLYRKAPAPPNSTPVAYASAHSYAPLTPFETGYPTLHCSSDVTIDGALHTYFKWVSATPAPGQAPAPAPDHMDVLLTTSLYTSGWAGAWNIGTVPDWESLPANGKGTASASDDEFGESVSISADPAGLHIPIQNSSHLGYHLKRVSTSDGVATVTLTGHTIAHADGGDPASCGTPSEMAWGRGGIDANAQQDSREATLHRDGAHDETIDPDGTVHGDTTYSYTNTWWGEGLREGENTDNVDNWQYFHPQFSGGWTKPSYVVIPPFDCPYYVSYQWNPNENSDTWDTGQWKMPYGSLNMNSGDWVGAPTGASPPSPITYTVTDNGDGATATAKYILTVHDPIEWNTSATISDLPPTLIGSCDHPVSAGSGVNVTYPPPSGTMNYSNGAKIFSIVGAGVSAIPVEGTVPSLAIILLSSISSAAGNYAPNTPYDQKPFTSNEGDFEGDVTTQVSINSGNTSGISFPGTARITGKDASVVAADPSDWYNDNPPATPGYWKVTGQVTEYRKKATWIGQTYDQGGPAGPTQSTADFRTRIGDVVRTWTFVSLGPQQR